MIFGSTIPAAGTAQLWQLNGGAPNDIKTVAPLVNGIDAPLVSNSILRLILKNVAGYFVDACGALIDTAAITFFSGVATQGAQIITGCAYVIKASGATISHFINDNAGGYYQLQANDGLTRSLNYQMTFGAINENASNSATNQTAQRYMDEASQYRRMTNAGTTVYDTLDTVNGFRVLNGVNVLFAITPAGVIKTNQSFAGAPGLPANVRIPVSDQAGVLLGYIDLNL